MYPVFASVEREPKPLRFRIPPYDVSVQTIPLQHQIMIPNPGKSMNNQISGAVSDEEDSNRRKCKPYASGHNEEFAAEDVPGQYPFHGGSGNGIESASSRSFGGGDMGIVFGTKYPIQMTDCFGVDVSNGGEYQNGGELLTIGPLKAVERRRKRMIKNRESAARSRARRQAYTSQLEIEVAELKRENALLKKRRKVMKDIDALPPPPRKQPKRASSAMF